jgi:hypothetical protein
MRTVRKRSTKHHLKEDKIAAVCMWAAKIPLKTIRNVLQISERKLRHILHCAESNPEALVPVRKPGSGRPEAITDTMLKAIKKSLAEDLTLAAKQLKGIVQQDLTGVETRLKQSVLMN